MKHRTPRESADRTNQGYVCVQCGSPKLLILLVKGVRQRYRIRRSCRGDTTRNEMEEPHFQKRPFSEKTAMRRGRTTVHEKEYNSTRPSNCQRPRIHWRRD